MKARPLNRSVFEPLPRLHASHQDAPYGLPPYNRARGSADVILLAPPPFSFPGVSARVFPLRANMNVLRTFCKSYLNVAPEVCEFRPYAPYVFLVVLDYGRMAAEEINLGWVSQHEIFFGVPLGKWVRSRRGGRRKFQEWVVNTPYIFVDDASSVTSGREVYGWPKVLVKLHPDLEEWLVDPRNPTRFLTVNVKGFGSHEIEGQRLLEIDQRLDQNLSLFPPDIQAIDPFERLSRLTRTAFSSGWDLAQLLLRAPLAGFGPQDPIGLGMILLGSLRQFFEFLQEPRMDALTLKQFPDAENTDRICYQALVQSRMSVSRFNRGGLLGLYNVLQGDVTGGFRIRIREHPSFPIVESLGLEVARERTVDGRALSVLEPFFPFWMNVDLTYGKGEALCWRMHDSPWFREGIPVPGPAALTKGRYNTFAGAAEQVWGGPFFIPDAHCDVFPLKAHGRELRRFVEAYLNVDERFSFRPWGNHVYMVVTSGRMFSEVRSAGCIESCLISFNVPVLWYECCRLKGFAVTRPFVFVDNPVLSMTMREVQGVPAMEAAIETPAHSWVSGGPVLRMVTDVFPVLDAGVECVRQTLIELVSANPQPRAKSSPPTASSPAVCELLRKLFCGEKEMQMLTLKQFRDTEQPHRACYQALVSEPWKLSRPRVTRLHCAHPIRLYRYPSLPLVDTLGLRVCSRLVPRDTEGAMADLLMPESPFRMEGMNIEIGRSEGISRTAGALPWEPFHTGDEMDGQASSRAAERMERILETCRTPQDAITDFLECVDDSGDSCLQCGPREERGRRKEKRRS